MFIFESYSFQPKAGLPRGGGVKENTLPMKQQVGFDPGLRWNALTTWPQCHSKMGSSACVGQKFRICYFTFVTRVATVDVTIVPCDAWAIQHTWPGVYMNN